MNLRDTILRRLRDWTLSDDATDEDDLAALDAFEAVRERIAPDGRISRRRAKLIQRALLGAAAAIGCALLESKRPAKGNNVIDFARAARKRRLRLVQ